MTKKDMQVLKFGGTSVGSAERMKSLVPLVVGGKPKIVVLSAMSGTTNALVAISECFHQHRTDQATRLITELEANYLAVLAELLSGDELRSKGRLMVLQLFDNLRAFALDVFTVNEEKAILAQGELLSTALFHLYLEEKGVSSVLLPALNFMRTDEREEPDEEYIARNLKSELARHPGVDLFITQGFITRNSFGEIDNLKRGGSDYTASLIGAAVAAEEVQIWTDIDGMHNNDPRVVKHTRPIHRLSFDEAAELAYFGAKILHPTCILPAKKRNIPVRILNTMQPEARGTVITAESGEEGVKAVAAKDGITAINIKSDRMLLAYGFLRAVFEVFERFKTPIDMITTSEVAVSLTIDNAARLEDILKELNTFGTVTVDQHLTIVCIVGDFSGEKAGYAGRVFEAMKDIPIRMISYGGSNCNVTVLVQTDHKSQALNALNAGLFNYDK